MKADTAFFDSPEDFSYAELRKSSRLLVMKKIIKTRLPDPESRFTYKDEHIIRLTNRTEETN